MSLNRTTSERLDVASAMVWMASTAAVSSAALAYSCEHPFELSIHQVLVGLGGAGLVVGVQGAVKQAQAHCVALALKEFDQGGRRVGGKLDLVHARFRRHIGRVVHRAGGVDHNLTAQVGLLLVGLDIEAVGPGVQLPVDVPHALAGVVQPVLGKLYTEPVVGTAVQARDKAFHRLLGEEFKGSDLAELVGLQVDGHGCFKDTDTKTPRCMAGRFQYWSSFEALRPSASQAFLSARFREQLRPTCRPLRRS